MRQTKKLVVVTTILAIGSMVALCFRKVETETAHDNQSSAAVGVARLDGLSSELPRRPKSDPTTRGTDGVARPIATEPRLTGHIEPSAQPLIGFGPSASPASSFDPTSNDGRATETQPSKFIGTSAEASVSTIDRFAPPKVQAHQKPLGWREPNRQITRAPVELARELDDTGQTGSHNVPAGRYRIVDGDTLAALAATYLGSANRAGDIYDYNRDVLASAELLPIGKELRIPPRGYRRSSVPSDTDVGVLRSTSEPTLVPIVAADATQQAPIQRSTQPPGRQSSPMFASPPPNSTTYIVQPHDTLALISRRVYGDLVHQQAIVAANQSVLKTAKDLRPGMTLVLPGRTD